MFTPRPAVVDPWTWWLARCLERGDAMNRSTSVAIALSVCVLGCNKTDSKPSSTEPAKTAEAKPPTPNTPAAATVPVAPSAAPAAPAAAECAPGAWKSDAKDHPQFCLPLPNGYKPAPNSPEKTSHHEWRYKFVGEGDFRPPISIMVGGTAKPALARMIDSRSSSDTKKVAEEDLPHGKRVVLRPNDYDKEQYSMEDEWVVLTKGETVDVKKECGSCPPWEWVVTCYAGIAKQAAADVRQPCRSIRMP